MTKPAKKSESFLHDIFDETIVTEDGMIADMVSGEKSKEEDEKSYIPLLRNKEALKGYKTKGSYFAECERNPDTSGCLPKGEHGHGKLVDPNQKYTPGISDETLDKLNKVGAKAIAKSKELREILSKNWKKIPKSLRYPVAGFIKVAYAGYLFGNKAVKEIAIAKGLKEEDAIKAARLATAFDVALGGSRAATVAALLGFPELSPVAAMLPVGSLSYLAFSTAKNPMSTLKAAKKAIQGVIVKKKEGIKYFTKIDNRFWEVKYSPDQPRGDKGTPEGGQFVESQTHGSGEGKLEQKGGSRDVATDLSETEKSDRANEGYWYNLLNKFPDKLGLENKIGYNGKPILHIERELSPEDPDHSIRVTEELRQATKAHIVKSLAKRMDIDKKQLEMFLLEAYPNGMGNMNETPLHPDINKQKEYAAQFLVDKWADTSSDSDKWATALQRIAGDFFDLENYFSYDPQEEGLRLREGRKQVVDSHYQVLSSYIQAVYGETQDALQKAGIEEMVLYRGMEIKGTLEESKVDPETEVQLQPLSSFSYNYKIAVDFAHQSVGKGKIPTIIATKVPREKIFSTSITGPGCLFEHEMVVLGGKMPASSVQLSSQTSKYNSELPKKEFYKAVRTGESPKTKEELTTEDRINAVAAKLKEKYQNLPGTVSQEEHKVPSEDEYEKYLKEKHPEFLNKPNE